MLKSSKKPLTREQFVILREARELITQELGEQLSLQSDDVLKKVYTFALQSDKNELFRLFTQLNKLSGEQLKNPLNEEQFVLLRYANGRIQSELDKSLVLYQPDVMDQLYACAKSSRNEELLDIYTFLASRPDHPATSIPLPHAPNESDERDSSLNFIELSAPEFERLRDAKVEIYAEFGEELSLHEAATLDKLYGFALCSEKTALFELFNDLLKTQMLTREGVVRSHEWLSKEQFDLLLVARDLVRQEFGAAIDLRSPDLLFDFYQYSLLADEETLFDLCWEFQQLCTPADTRLPSKEEFRLLRRARVHVHEEYGENLSLQPETVEYDLYRFAVTSDHDELYDLYSDLIGLPARVTPLSTVPDRSHLLRDELVLLRQARQLIRNEFDEVLPLESADVLDQVYGYALDSKSEALFDLHADLHAGARAEPVPETVEIDNKAEAEVLPEEAVEPAVEEPRAAEIEQAQVEHTDEEHQGFVRRLFGGFGKSGVEESSDDIPTLEEAIDRVETPAADNTAESPEENDQRDFGDMLVHAMQKEREKVPVDTQRQPVKANAMAVIPELEEQPAIASVKDVTLTEHKPVFQVVAKEAQDTEDRIAGRVQDSGAGWFVCTEQDRMRIRLTGPLHVGIDGDLLLVVGADQTIGATFQLIDEQPKLFVREGTVSLNGELVTETHELKPGDQISIGGETLLLDAIGDVRHSQEIAN